MFSQVLCEGKKGSIFYLYQVNFNRARFMLVKTETYDQHYVPQAIVYK